MALALLMGATSCEMTNGEEREPIDIGECIGRYTIALYDAELDAFDQAIIADWYLSTEDEALHKEIASKYMLYDNSFVTPIDEEGVVRMQYDYYNRWADKNEVRTFREFVTDGKLLSEGGVWRLKGAQEEGFTISGNEDGTFSYVIDNQNQFYKLVISNLNYEMKDGITYNVDGSIIHIDGDAESPKIILDTEITQTLEYVRNSYRVGGFKPGGTIAIECDDRRIDRVDNVELTFRGLSVARVKYLNQTSDIKY